MKVSEFIEMLQDVPGDYELVMSKDAEGNQFSPVEDISYGVYVPESTWSGEVHVGRVLTDSLIEAGYSEEDMYDEDDGEDCICIWPVN